ncbi:hypothetical protein BEWA_033450 [Theileria equi strain WA]|uniref:Suppressor of forked domain-containing protein n=1 Tax=Theileria equi strain WA TaxID=1537102 RepID=L0AY32_THEEQ|nr:hypothetical protein BEWA_033450 [Theileria equi strain WA]AFZ80492.1 hypothetical protein BEWA_033450 [Theileria equi strain WA]|eukprot:XP_004830158.1 hypothetical protein BEWA_033450 [Theileria equi strain WA]
MAERGATGSGKVITASQLLVSLLPDSSTLLPDKLSSITNKDIPSSSLLLDSPEDDNLWFKYLKITKTPELFEDACVMYPKYWKVHHRHALYYIFNEDTRKAYEIYNEAFKSVNDYDLQLKYLIFLYHTASIHEYIASVISAVDTVGMDYRSDLLWRELVIIVVKIYNCNLLSHGMTTGLLPDLFSADALSTSVPLIPSDAEQMVFRGVNTLSGGNKTYIQLYGEINYLRKLFQRWLHTPTNNMRTLWDAYSTFENSASSTSVLSTKILGDMKTVINLSMRTYEKISELYSKVYPIKPASMESSKPGGSFNVADNIKYWLDIIKYEETNPMETTQDIITERVLFTFERALVPLVFCSEMWYNYFQFLLFIEQKDKAITTLRLALEKYLKDDDKLRFVLASFLEEVGDNESAALEFGLLVSPGLKTSGMDENLKTELQLRQLLECKSYLKGGDSISDGIIHYLNFVRRERGMNAWREEIQILFTRSEIKSWEIYWYAANTELRCFDDKDRAVSILRQGQSKMTFNLKYTLLYLNTMLNIGKMNDVRMLLCELIIEETADGENKSKLTMSDKNALWNFWLHMEHYFGTTEQFDNVKALYISSKLSSEVSLDTFTEKSRKSMQNSFYQVFSDVGEVFIKKNMGSSKRKAVTELNSIIESRKKLFCAGVSFADLDNIFFFKSKSGKSGEVTEGTTTTSIMETMQPTEVIPSNETQDAKRNYSLKIARPNISRLSPVDPTLTTSLEALVQLHGTKRPLLPPKSRALDASGTPSKALFDFLRILPSGRDEGATFANLYVTSESVEYLLKTLDAMNLDSIDLQDYVPIPYNQIVSMKSVLNQLSSTNDTSFEFNQGLFNILRFLEEHTNIDDKDSCEPDTKKQKIAI